MSELPKTSRQVFSTMTDDAKVTLSIKDVDVRAPGDDEVVIKIQAASLHPSDFFTAFASADLETLEQGGTPENPTVSASIPAPTFKAMKKRVGIDWPIGNEGSGVVIAAGKSPAAQALIGKTVAVLGRAMYAEYITVHSLMCMPVADDVAAEECAAGIINPLTTTGILETTKMEGYKGLVHTAAASTIGQFLVKLCNQEDFPLVNIVRRPEQAEILRNLGAKYVCDSSLDSFEADLEQAIYETQAYMAFDAISGGYMGDTILRAMERAALRDQEVWSVYGSPQKKCVKVYGRLDKSNMQISPAFGMNFKVEGWLTSHFRESISFEKLIEVRSNIAKQLKTTFANGIERTYTMEEMLMPEHIKTYGRLTTGKKYLLKVAD